MKQEPKFQSAPEPVPDDSDMIFCYICLAIIWRVVAMRWNELLLHFNDGKITVDQKTEIASENTRDHHFFYAAIHQEYGWWVRQRKLQIFEGNFLDTIRPTRMKMNEPIFAIALRGLINFYLNRTTGDEIFPLRNLEVNLRKMALSCVQDFFNVVILTLVQLRFTHFCYSLPKIIIVAYKLRCQFVFPYFFGFIHSKTLESQHKNDEYSKFRSFFKSWGR